MMRLVIPDATRQRGDPGMTKALDAYLNNLRTLSFTTRPSGSRYAGR